LTSVIQLEGVSKRYRLYVRRHQSLKELLVRRSRGVWHDLWAVRDLTLDVPQGQVVGVIGENGSGKSTLLKLLSGILEPDAGRLQTTGRVSSLLELGAGFQPEYTGRENVYLYGALLGLKRREIAERYDEIVAFSELEDFIEYPVKNYSSGMYTRLGFSVAVHLRPEILLIDEVLAVGDESFQKKCYEHLNTLRREGCTILLVSHDLDAISRFCERAVWLDHGLLAADGPVENTINSYLDMAARRASEGRTRAPEVPGFGRPTGQIEILSVRFLDAGGRETRVLESGEAACVEVRYVAHEELESVMFNVTIFRSDGVRCTDAPSGPHGQKGLRIPKGEGVALLTFPHFGFHAGTYDATVAVHDPLRNSLYAYHERLYPFTMRDPNGGSAVVWIEHSWEIQPASVVGRRRA
jgi:ABC-type polysaccharide/polyol phosphate transport system ATPase subunit